MEYGLVGFSRREYQRKLVSCSKGSFIASRTMLAAAVVVGFVYTFYDLYYSESISDLWFILILDVATGFLIFGETIARTHMVRSGLAFFEHTNIGKVESDVVKHHTELFEATWRSRPRILFGLFYGTLIGGGSYVVSQETGQFSLAIWLTFFLFAVNFVTGSTLVSLFQFIKRSPSLIRLLNVNIWNLENPTTRYLIEVSYIIAAVGLIYVSMSFTAIIFSRLNINLAVAFYGAFAISSLSLGIFFPYLPIVRRASIQKSALLGRLSTLIVAHFNTTAGSEHVEQHAQEIERLINIHKKISDIRVIPYKIRLFLSFMPVLFTSWIPFVLKLVHVKWAQ